VTSKLVLASPLPLKSALNKPVASCGRPGRK
jgi:hypothetical protein